LNHLIVTESILSGAKSGAETKNSILNERKNVEYQTTTTSSDVDTLVYASAI
jgi:hypothetical protein